MGTPGHPNFADPAFEPTDEELQTLAHDAFSEVGERHREALATLRAQIETLRTRVLAELAGSTRRGPG